MGRGLDVTRALEGTVPDLGELLVKQRAWARIGAPSASAGRTQLSPVFPSRFALLRGGDRGQSSLLAHCPLTCLLCCVLTSTSPGVWSLLSCAWGHERWSP